MTTATGGTDSKPRWRSRRRQFIGAVLATATLAAATVAVISSDVVEAEAQFGAIPPPSTTTLCETDHPSEAEQSLNGGALDWSVTEAVTIDINSRVGDATDPNYGLAAGDSAYTGDFTYSVVLDNTGDPFDPDINNHPSYHPMASNTPVVLSGDGSGGSVTINLPRGCRYVMSVRATGHDLGGSWIRIEDDGTVDFNDVYMVTNDALPLAQVVVRAFHDFAQVNSQFDVGETGLAGFDVILEDGGEQSVDYFGNPICTNYLLGGDGVLDATDLDIDGQPTIDGANPGGNCLTDENGFATIQYLTAGKYEIIVQPPDTTNWVQTTTIEGSHIIDAWLAPGDAGIGGEFIGDINAGTFQAVGFVSPDIYPTLEDADPTNDIAYQYPYAPDAAGGDITGCFFNGQLYPTEHGVNTLVQNGIDNPDGTSQPLFDSYVALNDVGNHDSQMGLAETDDNGCFRFDDVPAGTYQLAVWDYELLYIIGFYNVTVDATTVVPGPGDAGLSNGVVDMGDMFVLRWRGWLSGFVFYDSGITKGGAVIPVSDLKDGSSQAAANGVRDCLGQNDTGFVYDEADPMTCEAGIPEQEVLVRNRNGTVWAAAISDANGYYELDNQWSPMFRFQVLEVGAGALDFTGHSVHNQFDRNLVHSQGNCTPADIAALDTGGTEIPETCLPAELGGGLLLAAILQQGKRTEVDFGKLSYLDPNSPNGFFGSGDGHGGIAGGVIQTITRAEWAGNKQGAEDNESGVPDAEITLYGYDNTCSLVDPVTGASGTDNPDCYTVPVESLRTDSYQHPGLGRNGQTCPMPTVDPVTGIPGLLSSVNPAFDTVADNCTGAWLLGAHTKDGAWNGGFAFTGMAPGFYVVELKVPEGYQIVKENDLNTEEGNSFTPALPPAGCVGEYHYAQLDDVYGSPYDAFDDGGAYNGADPVRLCDRRLLRVQPLRNAAVDFMVMTDGMNRTWQTNFTGVDEDLGTPGYQQTPVDPYTLPLQSWKSEETVPAPGRLFGLVLNDLTMTANQNSLTFGEQAGVVDIPIGVYDSTGGYVTTFWTDENGHYEWLMPSTFSINRATPGGVGAAMYQFVVNDPGPDGNNWGYDASFLTNPNTLDVWPQNLTVADTPTLALAAGPCALPTATPVFMDISDVYGTTGSLPTVEVRGTDLAGAAVMFTPQLTDGTLDAANAIDISAHAASLTQATPGDQNTFYDTVTIDLSAAEAAFGPFGGPYQLSFDDGTALGNTPRNSITFHVLTPGGAYDLEVFETAPVVDETDTVIQDAIDDAVASTDPREELVVINSGTFRESVVVYDGMVIQGHGSGGIIGIPTEQGQIQQIETPFSFITGSVVSPFGALLDTRMFTKFMSTISGITWDGNQGAEVGPAFQFLMEDGEVALADPFQLDGVGITGGRAQNGAVHVNGHAEGLVLSNLGIQSNNASQGGAGINLGVHSGANFVADPGGSHGHVNGRVQPVATGGTMSPSTGPANADNNVVIRDNRILQNGGVAQAGGVGIYAGNTYQFIDNDVCGNYSAEYGGGLSHTGESTGTIARNAFQNNESFDEGGGLFLGGEIAATVLGDGVGSVVVDANHIQYNKSGDDGGGIMVLNALEDPVRITNNVIAQNVATDVGGGAHLANASGVVFSHNTVAENMSANVAEDAGGFACNGDVYVGPSLGANSCPRAGGLTSQPHSGGFAPLDLTTFSTPALQNNIFWNNYAGYMVAGVADEEGNVVQTFGIADLGVYLGNVDQGPGMQLNPEYSVLSVPYGSMATNVAGIDPGFVLELPLTIQSLTAPVIGLLAEVSMVYPGTSPIEESDYHLASGGSVAADFGLLGVDEFDIDGQVRPGFPGPVGDNTLPDAGADEFGAATLSGLMFFSTVQANDGNLGIRDQDAQAWTALGISLALEGPFTPGVAAADIDGLHVIDETNFLVSFLGNNVMVPSGAGGVGPAFEVDDEDIIHYNATTDTWSMFLDGSAFGLTGGARDIDALHQLPSGQFLVSFAGFAVLPTSGGPGTLGVNDEDVVLMTPISTDLNGVIDDAIFEPYFLGSTLGLDGVGAGDVDGVALVGDTLLLSTRGRIQVGDLDVRDEDVIACGGLVQGLDGLWTCDTGDFLFFDGSAEGLAGNNDINAVSGPLAN